MAKLAVLRFRPGARAPYLRALRTRMLAAGYSRSYVADDLRAFRGRGPAFHVFGTDAAERACDVALEARGVSCRLREDRT